MNRHRKLMDVFSQPALKLRGAASPSDVRKVIVGEDEQAECSSDLDQEDPDPPQIKEEQEELWVSQEGEQLQRLEEADITDFIFSPVPVKSEDDEEKPQSSQLHQRQTEEMKTEADGEDCGGSEPAKNSHPERHLLQATDNKTLDSSETEAEDGDDDWMETRQPQSGLDSVKNNKVSANDVRHNTGWKSFCCSGCGKRFGCKGGLKRHMQIHTGEKQFSCPVCGKTFTYKANMTQHMAVHTGEKRYSCSFCDKRFAWSIQVKTHRCVSVSSQVNEGNLFSCSECGKIFRHDTNLKAHMRLHTGEKPFSCSFCNKRFIWHHQLQTHKCVSFQPSQLHQRQTEQMETEGDGEDCGGSEPARNSHPDKHLQPHTDDKTSDCSEPEMEDNDDDYKKTRELHSGLNSEKNKVPASDIRCNIAEKPFSCSLCGKRFDHRDYLNAHVRIHAEEKPFHCSFCGERFPRKATLISHLSVHTGDKSFSCSVCKKRFSYRVNVWSHMRNHAWKKRFNSKLTKVRDDDCQAGRESPSGLISPEHNEVPVSDIGCNTAEKPFSCSDCGKRFGRKALLKSHLRIHTGEKPFSCSVCGKRFAHRTNMTQHMAYHTGEKRYCCRVCDQRFIWYSQVKNHKCVGGSSHYQRQTEENRESELQGLEEVDIIKFTFSPVPVKSEDDEEKPQSSQLHQSHTEQVKTEADGVDPNRHLQPDTDVKTEDCPDFKVEISDNDKKETGGEPQSGLNRPKNYKDPASTTVCNNNERQFSCSECGKRFGCNGNLSRHMRTHTGEKPFICSVCGRGFADKATLMKHMRTHTGEKPFSCLVCGKRFSHRVSLKPHMLHHARKKQLGDETSQLIRVETFSCPECGKTFVRKDTLQEHVRTHTGEKPFSCSECGKTFCRKTNLRAHMRIHTGEKRFSCRSCHQRFTWHHQLKSHQCVGSGGPVRNRLLMPRPHSDEVVLLVYL
ncbi:zinc finger protein 665-like [Thunnus maccoyii]|uniref:zinc finger protein 665-like n=1 Tax=Thunnus maccoyii TaxID=8240 RepID=UPI001C4D6F0C|nr:zinc finger protein 665-like [Thunnus maccoyii]